MKKENLVLISNEKINNSDTGYFSDNIDMKSIPEGLDKDYSILLIGRSSKIKKSHEIKLKNIKLAGNIIFFLITIFKTLSNKQSKYLMVSITPYTFLAYIFLFFFKKEVFVYLRSDGYEEYKTIFPLFGSFLYHIMFTIVSAKARLISCRLHILKGKIGKVVSPSQLNDKWFNLYKNPDLKKIKLLYIGRIKKEKGIFSLLDILENIKIDYSMSVVSAEKYINYKNYNKNISLIEFKNINDSIIKIYDDHNIFILPSFTEGHPQVLDEALSRLRPVIIFDEISHVIGNRKGIFIAKRTPNSLCEVIDHIMNNYKSIQEKILQNSLPRKENFLKDMGLILKENSKI